MDVEEDLARGVEVEVPGILSLDDFLTLLCAKYPRFKFGFCPGWGLAPYARVFLNGRAVTGRDEKIGPGNEVVFFPAIHGG